MSAEDYFDDYDYEPGSQPTGCKFCGKTGLHWEDVDGDWVLFETEFKVHNCSKTAATINAETFDDLTQ